MKLENLTTIDQLVDFLAGIQAVAFAAISDKDVCTRIRYGADAAIA